VLTADFERAIPADRLVDPFERGTVADDVDVDVGNYPWDGAR
jgi:hypothetical protein